MALPETWCEWLSMIREPEEYDAGRFSKGCKGTRYERNHDRPGARSFGGAGMSDKTGIEWTDATWNPIRGCSMVSEGCRNCYAEKVAARFSGEGMPYAGVINPETGKWNGQIKIVEEKLNEPLRWKRPRKIFVNSMSDLFHENVPFAFVDQVFDVMNRASQHTFQILTKRPERMLDYIKKNHPHAPLENVWLGVSVEDQKSADERIPILLQTPAAVRWLSIEPLINAVNYIQTWRRCDAVFYQSHSPLDFTPPSIDWVVVGGESGPGARPMHPDWVRSIRDQSSAADVPFFFKQWGEFAPDCDCFDYHPRKSVCVEGYPIRDMFRCGKKNAGRLLDGLEWNLMPGMPISFKTGFDDNDEDDL
jgi:protein gp37